MNAQVEVHFHGIESSEAVERRVRDKVAKLRKHFSRMTSCRVGIEVPQRKANKPKVYRIKIEISVPRCAKKKCAIRERGSTGEGMLGT